jgi:hypothetical protein
LQHVGRLSIRYDIGQRLACLISCSVKWGLETLLWAATESRRSSQIVR